jgi:hypothetical protein
VRSIRPAAWILLIATALALAAIIWLPEPMANRTHGLKPAQHADAVASARTALLAFFAGVVAVASAGVAYASYRLSRRGQITDRLSRAIDQLGHESMGLRIGGIYTLEHLAREAPSEQPAIIEILTTVVRTQSNAQPPADGLVDIAGLYVITGDIQAALTVIGRRDRAHDGDAHLSLAGADLRNADLRGAQLQHFDLTAANMLMARIDGASFAGATLDHARIFALDLVGVDVTGASFRHTDLTNTRMTSGQRAQANASVPPALGTHSLYSYPVGSVDGSVTATAMAAWIEEQRAVAVHDEPEPEPDD